MAPGTMGKAGSSYELDLSSMHMFLVFLPRNRLSLFLPLFLLGHVAGYGLLSSSKNLLDNNISP